LTVLPQAEGKGDTQIFFSAVLGFGLWQHCQFLTLAFVVKNISLEGIDEYKRDCHQCRKISFLRMCILKKKNAFPHFDRVLCQKPTLP